QGTPQDIHPVLRDDIYRIAGEALRNAFRHAHARHIEVEIRYDDKRFQLRIRDDGKGIDAAALEDQRAAHLCRPGRRERAEGRGGQLEVWSQPGLGSEVQLTIPAAAAYATARARVRFRLFTKKTGTNA